MSKIPSQPPFLLFSSDLDSNQAELEGDCACPTWSSLECLTEMGHSLPLNMPLTQTPTHHVPLDSALSMLWPSSKPLGSVILDRRALAVWNRFSMPTTVASAACEHRSDLHLASQIELIERLWRKGFLEETTTPATILPPQELVTWIQLTDACNLDCTYCYIRHTRNRMSEVTGHQVIDAILRSAQIHGYRKVKVKYAGGEPLLRFTLLEDLHHYGLQCAEQRGITLRGVVLSNGTLLTPTKLETLRELRLSLMISMDEMPSTAGGQRTDHHRRNTATNIQRGIELALQHGLLPQISITLTNQNAPDLPNVVRWLLLRDLPFCINFVRRPQLAADDKAYLLDVDGAVSALRAAFKVIESNPPSWSLLSGLLDRANLVTPHHHACGAGENYLAFDCNGQVASCHMELGQAVTAATESDPLTIIQKEAVTLLARADLREECLLCDWRLYCGGGCPRMPIASERANNSSAPYCSIYRSLLPEVLRLEGLRILRRSTIVC